jgi:hypothetical protein
MKLKNLFFAILLLNSTVTLAEGGWVGSGGDGYTAMFRVACLTLADSIQRSPFERVPGGNYEVNWHLFEIACIKAKIHLSAKVQNGKTIWPALRDTSGNIRTALFVKSTNSGGFRGEIVLDGPKFIDEMKTNLSGAMVTVTHEIFKVIGLEDETNQTSAQVFVDYNKVYMDSQVKLDAKLKTLYQTSDNRMNISRDFENTEKSMSVDDTDRRMAKANKLIRYINNLLADLRTEIIANETTGIKLAAEYDKKYETHMAKLREQKKLVREAMDDFAEVFEYEVANMSFMNMFPSQGARTGAAAIRIAAAGLAVEPLRPKSTEMEWLEKQIIRLEEALVIETTQVNKYLKKRAEISERFLDVEIGRL